MSLTYQDLARILTEHGQRTSEWAGIPIPVTNHNLRLEPRFPHQMHVCNIDETQQGGEEVELINQWFCEHLRCHIGIVRDKKGKYGVQPVSFNGGRMLISTMFCSVVWPLEAEFKAQEKLANMVTHHAFSTYVKTGAFIETSKRSGVGYIFRRLKPTVALRGEKDDTRILCTLCLHPIGYYSGTWAGVMTPTDDVIAHLCMMRGDEPKFWANANQRPAHHPESGL